MDFDLYMRYENRKIEFDGTKLKIKRKAKYLSQEKLGQKIQMSNATISRFENGSRRPTLGTLRVLCEVLNVGLEELLKEV